MSAQCSAARASPPKLGLQRKLRSTRELEAREEPTPPLADTHTFSRLGEWLACMRSPRAGLVATAETALAGDLSDDAPSDTENPSASAARDTSPQTFAAAYIARMAGVRV